MTDQNLWSGGTAIGDEVDRAIRPLRILLSGVTAVLISLGERSGGVILAIDVRVLIAVVATLNLGWNALAVLGRHPLPKWRPGAATQIVVDLALALTSIAVIDAQTTPLAWILLLVPVIDAAAKFGFRGALVTWITVSTIYMLLLLGVSTGDSSSQELARIGIQQTAAVVAVAIPATALTRRFQARLESTEDARSLATREKQQLRRISSAAHDMSQATSVTQVSQIAVEAATELGFGRADLSIQSASGWQLIQSAGTPGATEPDSDPAIVRASKRASALSAGVANATSDEIQELHDLGYEAMTTVVVGAGEQQSLALRCYTSEKSQEHLTVNDELETLLTHTATAIDQVRTTQRLTTWAQQLDHQANHDELTGLPNRKYLLGNINAHPKAQAAVLFLDLDGFKAINDTMGHHAGDQVLCIVGKRLQQCLTTNGFVARLGGDEFVLVSYRREGSELRALADAVTDSLNEPIAFDAQNVQVNVSIGIAELDGQDLSSVLHKADQAMYEMKLKTKQARSASTLLESRLPSTTA